MTLQYVGAYRNAYIRGTCLFMFLNDNLIVSFESFYAQKHAAIVSVDG